MPPRETIHVDGSYGEGGGQILRTSVALSALTGRAIEVTDIRKNRPNPGLAPQHLHGVKAIQQLTIARIEGLEIGSTRIEFVPRGIRSGEYEVEIGTAGSISLILQVFMPPAAFGNDVVFAAISGGTDVKWSPPMDYLRNVFLKILTKMGYMGEVEIVRRGYYPRGDGAVKAKILPTRHLKLIELTKRGEFKKILGVSHSMNLPSHVVERQRKAALEVLKGYDPEITLEYNRGNSMGCGLTLWAEFENTVLGASSLGKLGKPAEKVGREAAQRLLDEINSGAPLDRYMGDQIIPYMALAKGTSKIVVGELTGHLKTNIYVTEEILGNEFEIVEEGSGYTIKTEGIGFENRFI